MSVASSVCLNHRISSALFGNPSIKRAWGLVEGPQKQVTPRRLPLKRRRVMPAVYEVDPPKKYVSDRLPRIWITEPIWDGDTTHAQLRHFVGVYPTLGDRDGQRALEHALGYICEARQVSDRRSEEFRIACYQAAEILLLHAIKRRNSQARLVLADLYQRDVCRGRYWESHNTRGDGCSSDIYEKAERLLAAASRRGCAEASLRRGMMSLACQTQEAQKKAVRLFKRAYRQATCENENGVDGASAALSAFYLAQCFERGEGETLSFANALRWYERAYVLSLHQWEKGAWQYKKTMIQAKRGMSRMRQEILGCY